MNSVSTQPSKRELDALVLTPNTLKRILFKKGKGNR
jgi:hypothetical protein